MRYFKRLVAMMMVMVMALSNDVLLLPSLALTGNVMTCESLSPRALTSGLSISSTKV